MRTGGTAGDAPTLQLLESSAVAQFTQNLLPCVCERLSGVDHPFAVCASTIRSEISGQVIIAMTIASTDHLDRITPALSFHHFRSHPAKRAAGRIAAGIMPGMARRDVRLRTEKMVDRREMAIAPRAAVVPRALMFDF